MSDRSGIPVVVRFILRLVLPEADREYFLGDLAESGRRSWTREILGALSLRIPASLPRPAHNEPTSGKGDGIMKELLFDLRYGLRLMARSPGYTAVALVIMALGIGANTAMFSIVNGVVLKPLPYPEADRIVLLYESALSRGWSTFSISPLNFWDWQERNRSLELMAAYRRTAITYTGGDRPESLSAYRVTEGFLPILGGTPALGRGIRAEDLDPNGEDVVVLSHGYWQDTFGGDPDVIGRTMALDDIVHTVVGVLPADWRPFSRVGVDVIVPLKPEEYWYRARGSHFLHGVSRLKEGVTLEQARADLSSIAAALEAEYPDTNTGWGATIRPLQEAMLGSAGSQLVLFLAVVGLVLLIACANLANMTLARAVARTRELAVRTALGAARGRVVRQLLVESVLLAAVGGVLGVILAYVALGAFVTGWPTLLPRTGEIDVNTTVLAFALALSLAAGVLFGLVPALNVTGSDIREGLGQGGRGLTGGRSRRWLRAGLVVGEVGLAVVLLVATGLLVRSYAALEAEDPGFRTEGRLVFETPMAGAEYRDAERLRAFQDATLTRLRALPGVEAAAISSLIPIEGSDEVWGFWLEGRTSGDGQEDGNTLFYRVTPGYFEAMGIPLLAGRGITAEDREEGRPVVVVSASLVERHFPGENVIGRQIRFGRDPDDPREEIVGVVGEVQHYRLGRDNIAEVYVPYRQRPSRNVYFAVRASVPPLSLVDQVRDAIAEMDPDQPVVGIQTADDLIADSISIPRFRTVLMTGIGVIALLLAVVGLYGVMAYGVARRTKEIGVRVALGATRGSVLGLVLRDGARLVGVGLVLGLLGALALSRVLESMLFGIGARDPAVFLAVPIVLAATAAAALLIPAQRATRIDPARTLAEE